MPTQDRPDADKQSIPVSISENVSSSENKIDVSEFDSIDEAVNEIIDASRMEVTSPWIQCPECRKPGTMIIADDVEFHCNGCGLESAP